MPPDHTWLCAEPIDTIWHRGGKPFDAGRDSLDTGRFPPTPWTFQGMIRTRLLQHALGDSLDGTAPKHIAQLVGPPDSLPEGWQIHGPFPARAEGREGAVEPWVQAPIFLWLPSREERSSEDFFQPKRAFPATDVAVLDRIHRQEPTEGSDVTESPERVLTCDAPSLLPFVPRTEHEPLDGWISARNLAWALAGRGTWDHEGWVEGSLPHFVKGELRHGVAMDPETGTAADHMLYAGRHHRFDPGACLFGSLSMDARSAGVSLGAFQRGMGVTGRKSRPFTWSVPRRVDQAWVDLCAGNHLAPSLDVPDPVDVWVTLLTPALVTEAEPPQALPFALPESGSVRITPVLALARRGEPIGGFQVGRGGRPVRSTWAAGSAWRFRLTGGTPGDRVGAARLLQGLPPHPPTRMEQFGFGQRLAGLFGEDKPAPFTNGGTHE